ncbi:MAG: hypothetical protein K5639_00335 [Eubacterium sp.]|nr:hypothetical protein [Eubacterium sp.]
MKADITMDSSGFVLLAEYIPHIIQEIRYYSTYIFIGERIDGYEEPCALLTVEAARALKSVSNELFVQGYRLKVYDAYRPACAVKHFVLWGIEDQDIRMKPYFYPVLMPLVVKLTKNYMDRHMKNKDVEPLLSYDKDIQAASLKKINRMNTK